MFSMAASTAFNVFDLVALPRKEEPHDRVLEWLCDPTATHGVADFAARIVRLLWPHPFEEQVLRKKRQFKLDADSYPDLVVEFTSSLLVIENKVNASALRSGQLEKQNELAGKKQNGKGLYHVLLCPDRLSTIGIALNEPSFAVLRYSQYAELVREILPSSKDEDAKIMLAHYAQHVERQYGKAMPPGLRAAAGSTIAKRNTDKQVWSEERFIAQAEERGSAELRDAQVELLDLIRSMEAVEPRFDSSGPVNATYKIYLAGTNVHFLWVYADGRLYVTWSFLTAAGHANAAAAWKQMWSDRLTDSTKKDGCNAKDNLIEIGTAEIAQKLQRIADVAGAKG